MKRNPHHTRRPDQPALFETGEPEPPGAYGGGPPMEPIKAIFADAAARRERDGRLTELPDGAARYTVPAPPRTGPDPPGTWTPAAIMASPEKTDLVAAIDKAKGTARRAGSPHRPRSAGGGPASRTGAGRRWTMTKLRSSRG